MSCPLASAAIVGLREFLVQLGAIRLRNIQNGGGENLRHLVGMQGTDQGDKIRPQVGARLDGAAKLPASFDPPLPAVRRPAGHHLHAGGEAFFQKRLGQPLGPGIGVNGGRSLDRKSVV